MNTALTSKPAPTPGAPTHHTPHTFPLGDLTKDNTLARDRNDFSGSFHSVYSANLFVLHVFRMRIIISKLFGFFFFCKTSTYLTVAVRNDCQSECQTVGLWFVMWGKGKFGGWSASVLLRKDTSEQKTMVWVLYRKIGFVCTEPSHLCRRLCEKLNRWRVRQLNRDTV